MKFDLYTKTFFVKNYSPFVTSNSFFQKNCNHCRFVHIEPKKINVKNFKVKRNAVIMQMEKRFISEIAKEYGLNLLISGKKFKIKCPFHEENTPSLILNDEINSYYCFGCGASGGMNKFKKQLDIKFGSKGNYTIEKKKPI